MKKTIKLTESDLTRIVNRVVNEQQEETLKSSKVNITKCSPQIIQRAKTELITPSNTLLTIQTALSWNAQGNYGVSENILKDHLVFTLPNGSFCYCKKTDFK